MQIKLSNLVYILLAWGAFFLPTQAMFVYVFHLPNFVQMIYPFVLFGFCLCLNIPVNSILSKLDNKFIILFLLFLLSILISMIINWNAVNAMGMKFTYFCSVYSPFWDKPDMRLLNWGLLRPIIFFVYISLLFVLLSFKCEKTVLLKYLIILAVISCTYSFYQIIALRIGLPYSSIFSGHSNNSIIFFGLRRVEGLFYEPGPQATFLSPIFCILFSQIFEKDYTKLIFNRRITILFLIMISIIMVLTISPIGLLTPFICTFFWLILNIKNLKITQRIIKKILIFCISCIVAFSGIIFFISRNSNSDFSFFNYMLNKILISTTSLDSPIVYSNPDSRSVRNYVAIRIFKEHPLVGVGQGGAVSFFSKYTPFANSKMLPEQNGVINTHLKILCELGLLGFVLYILILAYPYYLYVKKYHLLKFLSKNLINGLLIGYSIYIFISFQSTLQFWTPYFWMIYVLLITVIREKATINISQIITIDDTYKKRRKIFNVGN